MTDTSSLKVRVSRRLLLILALVGAVFFAAGLDVGVLHRVVDAQVGADKPFAKWAFVMVGLVIGGAITVNCLLYFIVPPTLLQVTRDQITFGTGLRYRPFGIPCSLLERVESYTCESMLKVNGKAKMVDGGAYFRFRQDPSIPSQLATSMGALYHNYELRISSTYADMSGEQITEAARRITGK